MADPESSRATGHQASGDCLCSTVGKAFRSMADALTPPEAAAQHFRDARKEILLGLREVLDRRIERLSRKDAQGTRIVVE